MNKAQPIKNPAQLENFKNYYYSRNYNPRNYMFITMGLNTALRVSDLLNLCWNDVYDFKNRTYREHVFLIEQKTQKKSYIYLNKRVLSTLQWYWSTYEQYPLPQDFLFPNEQGIALSRISAYRIVRIAAENCHIEGVISPHSLRKTFGYQAWKQGISPVLLMDIYQHSSFEITKRYLGIEQDERDSVFRKIVI